MAQKPMDRPMTSRERFQQTMGYGRPDRVPCFDEGIREEVVQHWQTQGLAKEKTLADVFRYDRRREIIVDLEPRPQLKKFPATPADLRTFRKRLDPSDPARFSRNWEKFAQTCKQDDATLMLRVHSGFFLTMGVHQWSRFMEVMDLILDHPQLVREIMTIQGEFNAEITEKVLKDIDVHAVIFSEPIGGNDKPLISPGMYENFVLNSFQPILDVVKRHGVTTIVFRTYGNARVLIPSVIKWGFNCIWACEAGIEAMDYRDLRRQFGKSVRLIGGIDLNVLRLGKSAIQREVEEKVPSLLADGGYVPLADGRVREDVPYENYVFYRNLLKKIVEASAG